MRLTFRDKQRLQRLTGLPVLRHLIQVHDPEMNTDQDYWKNAGWASRTHPLEISLLGRRVLSLSYQVAVEDVYLNRNHAQFLGWLEELIATATVPPLDADSRVLEAGCNVGGLLRELQRRHGCEVYGLDIAEDAIRFARERVFAGNPRATFLVQDVLEPGFFARFETGFFSHAFCLSHLVHVPNTDAKSVYIEELKRIARVVVLYERMATPERPARPGRHYRDYERDHGFTLFRSYDKPAVKPRQPRKPVGLYYHVSGDPRRHA
jgi:SAM-dependent methyltransferase